MKFALKSTTSNSKILTIRTIGSFTTGLHTKEANPTNKITNMAIDTKRSTTSITTRR